MIAEKLVLNRKILVFEKDDNSIEFFKFRGDSSNFDKMVSNVLPMVRRISVPSSIESSFMELEFSRF